MEGLGFGVRHGVQYHWVNAGYARYDDFLARFNSKRRNQLRREAGAAETQGLTLQTLRGDALKDVDPQLAFRLYVSTVDKHLWGKRHLNPSSSHVFSALFPPAR